METIRCDLCGSDAYDVLFEQTDLLHRKTAEVFRLVRCRECGLHYQNPRPSAAEIGQYYINDYAFHAEKSKSRVLLRETIQWIIQKAVYADHHPVINGMLSALLLPFQLIPGLRQRFPSLLAPHLKSYLNPAIPQQLLDIGCGSGDTLHLYPSSEAIVALAQQGWKVSGVEVSERARETLAKRGIRDVHPDLFAARFNDNQFDVVRMNWSLEHVHTPMRYFQECKRVLKPGGSLIIGIPNYDGIAYRLFPNCVEFPIHLYYFTPATIKRYCSTVGLRIVDYFTFSYVPLHLETYRVIQPDLYQYYLRHVADTVALARFLDQIGRLGCGDDMVFCLSK